MIIFDTSLVFFSEFKHWKIALCSLSIGMILVLCFFASGKIISPATTILSLFANKIIFPVCTAIKVVSKPEKPDIADIIMSILLCLRRYSNSDFSENNSMPSDLSKESFIELKLAFDSQ